jgi:hypothetical protein
MRRLALALSFATFSTAALADAVTTRIETRPYYGAIVTIEQGVRVWRALPPHDRIIIVPESAKNVRVNIDASSHKHQAPPSVSNNVNINNSGNVESGGAYGIPLGYGARPHHGGYNRGHQGRTGAFPGAPRHH